MMTTPTAVLTRSDIEKGLRDLGLAAGDVVLLHSSLASLGYVEGGAETVVNAFISVLGTGGTLVVPTFGDLGIITSIVRNHPQAVNSIHPRGSVAAIGAAAEAICKDHWKAELVHGPDTPYLRIVERGGYVLLLGVDQDRSTMLHSVEELLRAPYLSRTAEFTFDTPEGKVSKSWPYFPGPHRDFMQNDALLLDEGVMNIGRIGQAVARLLRAKDMIGLLMRCGQQQPDWALCDNPSCADCVKQRAALRRHRFDNECFRLAASAQLAGRYIPEMIENARAAGIAALELDVVQGRPAWLLEAKPLAQIREELEQAGLAVSALRVATVTEKDRDLLARAAEAGIKRVIMPLNFQAVERAHASAELGIELSFYNTAMSSGVASAIVLEMKTAGLTPRCTFNAANFARAGESPYLRSYKQKLRRFVDQLDVEDARSSAEPTVLARGNAEIKEMISVLRCASFSGWFVLGAGNAVGGNLQEAVTRFETLLDRM